MAENTITFEKDGSFSQNSTVEKMDTQGGKRTSKVSGSTATKKSTAPKKTTAGSAKTSGASAPPTKPTKFDLSGLRGMVNANVAPPTQEPAAMAEDARKKTPTKSKASVDELKKSVADEKAATVDEISLPTKEEEKVEEPAPVEKLTGVVASVLEAPPSVPEEPKPAVSVQGTTPIEPSVSTPEPTESVQAVPASEMEVTFPQASSQVKELESPAANVKKMSLGDTPAPEAAPKAPEVVETPVVTQSPKLSPSATLGTNFVVVSFEEFMTDTGIGTVTLKSFVVKYFGRVNGAPGAIFECGLFPKLKIYNRILLKRGTATTLIVGYENTVCAVNVSAKTREITAGPALTTNSDLLFCGDRCVATVSDLKRDTCVV